MYITLNSRIILSRKNRPTIFIEMIKRYAGVTSSPLHINAATTATGGVNICLPFLTATDTWRMSTVLANTPQPLGTYERLKWTLEEGITTLLSQSGLLRSWWEDTA